MKMDFDHYLTNDPSINGYNDDSENGDAIEYDILVYREYEIIEGEIND
jgi:hypothetical protein